MEDLRRLITLKDLGLEAAFLRWFDSSIIVQVLSNSTVSSSYREAQVALLLKISSTSIGEPA